MRVTTLFSDVSVGMAEATTNMSVLYGESIDGKSVKGGIENRKGDDGEDVEESDEGHRKEKE